MSSEVRRLFAETLPAKGGLIRLDEATRHHVRVLRLAPGDPIRVFDGQGREAVGRIVRVGEDAVECEVESPCDATRIGPEVVLVQALPKGGKLDDIVRMTTELGVTSIHLAITERTVARPDAKRADARVRRLERIVREASRQARRATIPDVVAPARLEEVVCRAPADATKIVLWERGRQHLANALTDARNETWLVVGPEGGLPETEVRALQHSGWRDVGLGANVLRVETAAPVAVALALDRLGRMQPPREDDR